MGQANKNQKKTLFTLIITMNFFILISIIILFKVYQPADPELFQQFRSQIRGTYLISAIIGNLIMFYFYRNHDRFIKEAQEREKEKKQDSKTVRKLEHR